PSVAADALVLLAAKPNLRVLATGALTGDGNDSGDDVGDTDDAFELRSVTGGLLVQQRDRAVIDRTDLRVVSRRQPDAAEFDDLLFAWTVVQFVKSNAIVFAR